MEGSKSPYFVGSGTGYTGKATTGVAVSATTRYVAVVHLYHFGAGRTVRVEVKESGAGAGNTVVDFSTNDWPQGTFFPCVVAHTTTGTPGNLSIEITTDQNHQYHYDGLMLYARSAGDLIPLIGGGVTSTQSDLRYKHPFTDAYRNGFCCSFWMKRNGTLPVFTYVCAAGSISGSSPYGHFRLAGSFDVLSAVVRGTGNFQLSATMATDMPTTWAHYFIGYNPSASRLEVWLNGVSDAVDSTVVRITPDMSETDTDLLFGRSQSGTFYGMPGPIAAFQLLPFPGSDELAAAFYNAGNGGIAGPQGVVPLSLSGDILDEVGALDYVPVTPKLDSTPNDRWWKDGVFQHHGGRLAFTLTEVTSI
jgi:hypothetical protein